MIPSVIFGMNLGPHADFIVAAYAFAAAVIVLLVGWVTVDHFAQRHRLSKLEAHGMTRRSERAAGTSA